MLTRLFNRRHTPEPQVIFGIIVANYSSEQECWSFEYEGIEHVSYGHILRLFNNSALELIQKDILMLVPEMKERLIAGWKEWGEVKIGDGEKFFVDVTNYQQKQEYQVHWAGGANWGDMGIEFTIKDHQIVDENWSD